MSGIRIYAAAYAIFRRAGFRVFAAIPVLALTAALAFSADIAAQDLVEEIKAYDRLSGKTDRFIAGNGVDGELYTLRQKVEASGDTRAAAYYWATHARLRPGADAFAKFLKYTAAEDKAYRLFAPDTVGRKAFADFITLVDAGPAEMPALRRVVEFTRDTAGIFDLIDFMLTRGDQEHVSMAVKLVGLLRMNDVWEEVRHVRDRRDEPYARAIPYMDAQSWLGIPLDLRQRPWVYVIGGGGYRTAFYTQHEEKELDPCRQIARPDDVEKAGGLALMASERNRAEVLLKLLATLKGDFGGRVLAVEQEADDENFKYEIANVYFESRLRVIRFACFLKKEEGLSVLGEFLGAKKSRELRAAAIESALVCLDTGGREGDENIGVLIERQNDPEATRVYREYLTVKEKPADRAARLDAFFGKYVLLPAALEGRDGWREAAFEFKTEILQVLEKEPQTALDELLERFAWETRHGRKRFLFAALLALDGPAACEAVSRLVEREYDPVDLYVYLTAIGETGLTGRYEELVAAVAAFGFTYRSRMCALDLLTTITPSEKTRALLAWLEKNEKVMEIYDKVLSCVGKTGK